MMHRSELVGAHRPIPGNGAPQVKQVQPVQSWWSTGCGNGVWFSESQFTNTPVRSQWSLWGWVKQACTKLIT